MSTESTDRVRARLRSFRAIDDPAGCEQYFTAHRAALEFHRTRGVTSLDPEWFGNPLAHAVLLESLDGGEALAGIRVQLADGGRFALPTELAYRDAKVHDYVRRRLDAGIGEVCGAWTAPTMAKTTIFQLVACACLSLTTRLGVSQVLASCAAYTVKTATDLGLVIERSLGDEGTFRYPTPDNLAYLVVLRDTATFEHATAAYRETIFDLRARPQQHRTVDTGRLTFDIDVDLSR
jgi:hypothetical protein